MTGLAWLLIGLFLLVAGLIIWGIWLIFSMPSSGGGSGGYGSSTGTNAAVGAAVTAAIIASI